MGDVSSISRASEKSVRVNEECLLLNVKPYVFFHQDEHCTAERKNGCVPLLPLLSVSSQEKREIGIIDENSSLHRTLGNINIAR